MTAVKSRPGGDQGGSPKSTAADRPSIAPDRVTAVLTVDVSDQADKWHPDPRERVWLADSADHTVRGRLSALSAAPRGALVRLRVGATRPPLGGWGLDDLGLDGLRFEIETSDPGIAREWVAAFRRVVR